MVESSKRNKFLNEKDAGRSSNRFSFFFLSRDFIQARIFRGSRTARGIIETRARNEEDRGENP